MAEFQIVLRWQLRYTMIFFKVMTQEETKSFQKEGFYVLKYSITFNKEN